jgi:hypothetical protein
MEERHETTTKTSRQSSRRSRISRSRREGDERNQDEGQAKGFVNKEGVGITKKRKRETPQQTTHKQSEPISELRTLLTPSESRHCKILAQGVENLITPIKEIKCGLMKGDTAQTKTGKFTPQGFRCDCCKALFKKRDWCAHTGLPSAKVHLDDFGMLTDTKTIKKLTLAGAATIVEQVKTGLLTIKSQYTILSQGVGQCCSPVTKIFCGSMNTTTAQARTKTGQLTRYGLQCNCCEKYMNEDRWRDHTGKNTSVYIEDWGLYSQQVFNNFETKGKFKNHTQ